jgi:hypothetical protein
VVQQVATPKSLNTSPNTHLVSVPPVDPNSIPSSSTHGLTPSPPTTDSNHPSVQESQQQAQIPANVTDPPALTLSAEDNTNSSLFPSTTDDILADGSGFEFSMEMEGDGGFGGDYDFGSLLGMGEGNSFDFAQYLREDAEGAGEGGVVKVP